TRSARSSSRFVRSLFLTLSDVSLLGAFAAAVAAFDIPDLLLSLLNFFFSLFTWHKRRREASRPPGRPARAAPRAPADAAASAEKAAGEHAIFAATPGRFRTLRPRGTTRGAARSPASGEGLSRARRSSSRARARRTTRGDRGGGAPFRRARPRPRGRAPRPASRPASPPSRSR